MIIIKNGFMCLISTGSGTEGKEGLALFGWIGFAWSYLKTLEGL